MKLALSLIAGAAIAAGPTSNSPSFVQAEHIFKKSRDAYAALNSYSDDGTYFQHWAGMDSSFNFRAEMSRPDLYRVFWVTKNGHKSIVWCAGDDDFVSNYISDQGKVRDLEKVYSEYGDLRQDQIKAMSQESNLSDAIVTAIPGVFFDVLQPHGRTASRLSPIFTPAADEKQLPDAKIGDADCYVFTGSWKPERNLTVWIGKSDYLIRQIKIVKPKDLELAIAEKKPRNK